MAEHQDPPEPQDEPESQPERPKEITPQKRAVMDRAWERTVGRKRRLGKPIPSPPQSEQESVPEQPQGPQAALPGERTPTPFGTLSGAPGGAPAPDRPPPRPEPNEEGVVLRPPVSADLFRFTPGGTPDQPSSIPGLPSPEPPAPDEGMFKTEPRRWLPSPEPPASDDGMFRTEPRRWLPESESDIPRPDQEQPGFPGLQHPRPEFPRLDQPIPSDNAEASNQAGDGAGLVQGLDELTRLVEEQSRTLEEVLSLLREIKAELPKVGGLT